MAPPDGSPAPARATAAAAATTTRSRSRPTCAKSCRPRSTAMPASWPPRWGPPSSAGTADLLTVGVDTPADDGDTALHLACLYSHPACVQTLLAAGASPQATDEDGSTPLHDAAASGCSVAVGMLLSAVASEQQQALLKAADADGDTPLHNAARGGHADVVTQLLEAGSSPLAENNSSKTPGELADPDTEAFSLLEKAAAVARHTAQRPASLPPDIHSGS
eukprot:SM000016S01836  [mRNA]  locus=s16:95839:97779:+ [translate_table: standard]